MGSNFFGESTLRSGSTRKGKKSNSDKPKKPQRGLGVAQLEKIRLQNQIGINYYPGPPGTMSGPCPTSFDQDDVRVQKGYQLVPSSGMSYLASTSPLVPYGFYPGFMVAMDEHERANSHFDHHQPTHRPSWDSSKSNVDMTRPFLNIHPEHLEQNRNSTNHFNSSKGSSNQNSKPKNTQEIDLELKLSI